jgi:hypothetical protein
MMPGSLTVTLPRALGPGQETAEKLARPGILVAKVSRAREGAHQPGSALAERVLDGEDQLLGWSEEHETQKARDDSHH